jgi:hypothetical protein
MAVPGAIQAAWQDHSCGPVDESMGKTEVNRGIGALSNEAKNRVIKTEA